MSLILALGAIALFFGHAQPVPEGPQKLWAFNVNGTRSVW